MSLNPEAVEPSLHDDFMELARERYTQAKEADADDVRLAQSDVDFVAGDQWTEAAIELRNKTHQPILTWNRMHTFVQQVANDGRENKPAINVSPSDGGTPEDSQMLQGRIRQIEYESNADVAYDTSREQQVVSGRGFYRIVTEFKPGSMKQKISIKPILNQFSVLCDPQAKEYDKTDAEYWFIESPMTKAAYRRTYGAKTKLATQNFGKDDNGITPGWVKIGPNGTDVLVCEYWVKEFKPRTLVELQNGENAWKDELPADAAIVSEREEQDWTVCQYVIDAYEVLYKTQWPGKIIPICPMYGRQEVVRGKLRNISLVRHSHDEQRLVNLYVSNIAHEIGSMSKATLFMYEGQEMGHEDELATLNIIPRPYQLFSPVTDRNGNVYPLPQLAKREPVIQGLTVGLGQAIDGLKASMGIYDASLGNAPADASGLAINARNKESDLGNFHFYDNESRTRNLAGRILLELIPKVDAGQSTVPIRTVDGKTQHVPLDTPYKHPETGRTVTHKLDDLAGKHEPTVSTGPSYTSARQQAYAVYARLAETDKGFMQIAGDQLFRNMDAPGADVIADRYAKMLPAPLQQQGNPAQLQGQLQQASQMVQHLSATVHKLQDEHDKKTAELATREKIAAMQEETKRIQIQTQAVIAEATLQSKANVARLQTEVGAIQHSIETVSNEANADFEALLAHYQSMGAGDPAQATPDQGAPAPTDDSAPAQDAPAQDASGS